MESRATKILCSNSQCRAVNSLSNQFCDRCGLPVVKRYLRLLGAEKKVNQPGKLLGDRYLVIQPGIVLDTKPGLVPQSQEIPGDLVPYLRLLPYRLHIPQIFGVVYSKSSPEQPIWLLEYHPVAVEETGELPNPELFPKLTEQWQTATALRQLNWLWQIAQLWQPLHKEKVAYSLLNPWLLRVSGAAVVLLQLQPEEEIATLRQLGQLWSVWVEYSAPQITEFLQQLCQKLLDEQIGQPDYLSAILEEGIAQAGQTFERNYQIFTLSDPGLRRDRNEDACYPPSDQLVTASAKTQPLAMVCDGLGGQESGEIASQLAIDELQVRINNLITAQASHPNEIELALERAIYTVNDLIVARNDQEQRYERQRMATTLTMALAHAHYIYLAHLGDSRIYWITATGCHQITVDDNLASREVRLGYALYREVVRSPHAKALLQALGIDSSEVLAPTVQRLVLDEDGIFLLCSDGLSDFERVEQYWQATIVPLLQQKSNLTEVGKQLLEIANQRNGHDNVTFALFYYQVKPLSEPLHPVDFPTFESSLPLPASSSLTPEDPEITVTPPVVNSLSEQSSPRQSRKLIILLITIFVLGLGVTLGVWFWEPIKSQIERFKGFFDSNSLLVNPAQDVAKIPPNF